MDPAERDDILRHLVFLVARQEDTNTQQAALNERLTTAIEHLDGAMLRIEYWIERLDTFLLQQQRTQERAEALFTRVEGTLGRLETLLARLLRHGGNGAA